MREVQVDEVFWVGLVVSEFISFLLFQHSSMSCFRSIFDRYSIQGLILLMVCFLYFGLLSVPSNKRLISLPETKIVLENYMVGRLVSFWGSLLAGAMLLSESVGPSRTQLWCHDRSHGCSKAAMQSYRCDIASPGNGSE